MHPILKRNFSIFRKRKEQYLQTTNSRNLMINLLKRATFVFMIVILSNVSVDLVVGDRLFLENPLRFLGTSLVLSLIAGALITRIGSQRGSQ